MLFVNWSPAQTKHWPATGISMAEQLVEVVVGKRYKVPCAKMLYGEGKVKWLPIIGIEHCDPQFGARHTHYHIDGRFTKSNVVDYDGKTNAVVWTDNDMAGKAYKFVGIETKYRMCVRQTTGIKPPVTSETYYNWYKGMVGKSCKGRKCPHYGATMLERDGVLVCPLHGLIGSIEEEVIVENKQEDVLNKIMFDVFNDKA